MKIVFIENKTGNKILGENRDDFVLNVLKYVCHDDKKLLKEKLKKVSRIDIFRTSEEDLPEGTDNILCPAIFLGINEPFSRYPVNVDFQLSGMLSISSEIENFKTADKFFIKLANIYHATFISERFYTIGFVSFKNKNSKYNK